MTCGRTRDRHHRGAERLAASPRNIGQPRARSGVTALGREPLSEPATNCTILSFSGGCASFPLLAVWMCCRESKTVQYGVQFHSPRGRETQHKEPVRPEELREKQPGSVR